MENWASNGWRWGREEDEEEEGGGDAPAAAEGRCGKRLKCWTGRAQGRAGPQAATTVEEGEEEAEAALWRHREEQAARETALARLGVSNRADPLTGTALEPRRPVALLVSEDGGGGGGGLTGFDLFSLYHLVLKKGKSWFRTPCCGSFRLQPPEIVSLCNDYARYFGTIC